MDFESFCTDTLRDIDRKIDDLCERTTRLETSYKNHVEYEVEKKASKFKTITIIFAIITSVSTLVSIAKLIV